MLHEQFWKTPSFTGTWQHPYPTSSNLPQLPQYVTKPPEGGLSPEEHLAEPDGQRVRRLVIVLQIGGTKLRCS